MQTQLSQLLSGRTLLLLIGVWVLLSVSQTVHFYLYYEQTLLNSIYWSFRDWLVWFAIFAFVFVVTSKHKHILAVSPRSLLIVTTLAICTGVVHILIVNSIGNLVGTATRPFWVDFGRLYSKRWLQYLFTFGVFWLLLKNYFSQRSTVETNLANDSPQTTLKVNDGKKSHWLKLSDIAFIEAAGNYACIDLGNEQLIIRATLKSIESQLPEPTFLRVSRSHIVNTHAIGRSARVSRSKLQLEMNNGTTISVGRSYWSRVKQALEI